MNTELESLRAEIERVDKEMIELFARRMELSAKIGGIKRSAGLPVYVPEREKELKKSYSALAGAELGQYVERLYEEIFALSRERQEKNDGRE